MKKIFFIACSALLLLWTMCFVDFSKRGEDVYGFKTAKAATTGSISLTGNILEYLALTLTTGTAVGFGNITPGTPKCGTFGTVVSIITNAQNGYNLATYDGEVGAVSSMVHSDGTHIPDMNIGTIATPILWVTGTHAGVGVTLYAADTDKEASWGTGSTMCDVAGNKYGAVPQAATTGHTVTGYHTGADTSSWGWRIDVPNTQKTGIYTGTINFSSAAVLS
jgi:hypothetical protein